MRTLQFFTILYAFFSIGCASDPVKPKGFELPPALSEVYRGGTLAPMQQADSADLGMPNQYDLVDHTCSSRPMYDIYGRYTRTDVRCW